MKITTFIAIVCIAVGIDNGKCQAPAIGKLDATNVLALVQSITSNTNLSNTVKERTLEDQIKTAGVTFDLDAASITSVVLDLRGQTNVKASDADLKQMAKVLGAVGTSNASTQITAVSTSLANSLQSISNSLDTLSASVQANSKKVTDVSDKVADVSVAVTNATNTVVGVSNTVQTIVAGISNAAPVHSKWYHAEAGTVVLSPFLISPYAGTPGTFELKPDSADVRGMIQVVVDDRYAWRNASYSNPDSAASKEEGAYWWPWQSSEQFPLSCDLGLRIGYAYGGSSGSQSSATTGSGDFFGEASFGFNLYKYWYQHDANKLPFVYTVNLESFGSFASDKRYNQLHPAGGVGIAYVAGIPYYETNKIQFVVRPGYAWVDSPHIIGSTTNSAPMLEGIGGSTAFAPKFSMRGAATICAELRLPIVLDHQQFGYLSLGGTAYKFTGNSPDQWSLYAALSFSLEDIVKAIIPKN